MTRFSFGIANWYCHLKPVGTGIQVFPDEFSTCRDGFRKPVTNEDIT